MIDFAFAHTLCGLQRGQPFEPEARLARFNIGRSQGMMYRPNSMVVLCNIDADGVRLMPADIRIFNGMVALILGPDPLYKKCHEIFVSGARGFCHEEYMRVREV